MDEVRRASDRLARLDPVLRAVLEVVPTGDALRLAGRPRPGGRGPLHGVPIVVKGSRGLHARQTLTLVAAGAVPIGTTSTPRGPGHQTWGHTDRGPTRNPWRADLSPGGSSAGSAAAVAAGIVELGTGSDGAGSVRIPAAWCGIYGYKPTTALARRAGYRDRSGWTVPGPLVRDPRLLAPWAAAVLGPLPATPQPVTATWSPGLGYAGHLLDDEVVGIAARGARDLAARAGLRWRACAVTLADPQTVWETARDGSASAAARRDAAALRTRNDAVLAALFDDVDVLLTPTTPGRPHGHDGPGEHLSVALTWAFNVSGHPAVSVPVGRTADGAPVGVQLVVRPHADAALLELLGRWCHPAPVAPPLGPPG